MKKILSLVLLISIIFPTGFVDAKFSSNVYKSLHVNTYDKYYNGKWTINTNAKGFTDPRLSYYKGSYWVIYEGKIPYINNVRFFIPNFTKGVRIVFTREGSLGYLQGLLSMGKLPSFGKNNKYKNGQNSIKAGECLNLVNCLGKEDDIFFTKDNIKISKLLEQFTIGFLHARGIFITGNIEEKYQDKLNKWMYFATDDRKIIEGDNPPLGNLMGAFKMTYSIRYYIDKEKVDKYVDDNKLEEKYKFECNLIKEDAKKACYYIKSFGPDGDDRDISTHSQTAKNFNNLNSTTQIPPTNSSMGIETSNSIKKTSTIKLIKNLNLISFKGYTRLKDLRGCNIGKYDKGQYKGKQAIFGVKGGSFLITPNNAETSLFEEEMGVFIYTKEACTLKYSYTE